MRSYKEAVAFAEMARIQRKLRSGDATAIEKERYQYLLQRNDAGVSARLYPSSPAPILCTQTVEREEEWQATNCTDVMWKRGVPPTLASIQIRPPINDVLNAPGKHNISPPEKRRCHLNSETQYTSYLKSMPIAQLQALRMAQERVAQCNDTERIPSHQVRVISPKTMTNSSSKTTHIFDSCVDQKKRLLAPVPMRETGANNRKHLISEASASKESSALIGILRNHKSVPTPSSYQSPKIDATAFMRAMRASQVTRGQQKSLLDALRGCSGSDLQRSAFESIKNHSKNQHQTKEVSSPPPAQVSASTTSQEEASRARRLAWMRSAKEIMSQSLSPSVLRKDIRSNPNVSTTHLLRRIGNPHRRVIHQMLRDQNKRILNEMKKQVAIKSASPPIASPSTVAASPVATGMVFK
ncbi:hypothetical protein IV203_026138 [Nitzschia inconspicua]|uniref:Uncharacterized protein n=1 Tax=Nitzschia inconspicua TaxID=303405 RepID=A0A9K3LJE8_9STRA|nr:hypothetical protein IV203_026138 [Nitzschia inconspicua]